MLDHAQAAADLLQRMQRSLPLAAAITPELAAIMAARLPEWPIPPLCPVVGVTYLGDEGGIICRLALGPEGKLTLLVAVSMLDFEADAALGPAIAAYCEHRSAQLQARAEKQATRVPRAMAERFAALAGASDAVCLAHLDAEYATLAREALAAMCRKRPSPVVSGKPAIWAAAVVYEVGRVNFLTDPSQSPHMTTRRLCELFGISEASLHAKAKLVRTMLGTHRFEPRWTRADMIERHPYARIAEMLAGGARPWPAEAAD